MVKQWLNRENIEFTDSNIEEDPTSIKYLQDMGFKNVPVVFNDNELVCTGFNLKELRKLRSLQWAKLFLIMGLWMLQNLLNY